MLGHIPVVTIEHTETRTEYYLKRCTMLSGKWLKGTIFGGESDRMPQIVDNPDTYKVHIKFCFCLLTDVVRMTQSGLIRNLRKKMFFSYFTKGKWQTILEIFLLEKIYG